MRVSDHDDEAPPAATGGRAGRLSGWRRLAVGAAASIWLLAVPSPGPLTGSLSGPSAGQARTLRVRAGAPIQAALAAAAPGDTVRVAAGKFSEALDVPAGVRLIGAGSGRTIIEQERGTVIRLRPRSAGNSAGNSAENAAEVLLRDLTVQGGAIGIEVEGGAPRIVDCWIRDCTFYGVSLAETARGELRRVLLRDNTVGVLARSGARTLLRDCAVRGNRNGVKVQNAFPVLAGCTITGNQIGMLVQGIGRPLVGERFAAANRIYRNRRANLRNETGRRVPARYNFWGDVECKFLAGFQGDVAFLPFLDLALADSLHACP